MFVGTWRIMVLLKFVPYQQFYFWRQKCIQDNRILNASVNRNQCAIEDNAAINFCIFSFSNSKLAVPIHRKSVNMKYICKHFFHVSRFKILYPNVLQNLLHFVFPCFVNVNDFGFIVVIKKLHSYFLFRSILFCGYFDCLSPIFSLFQFIQIISSSNIRTQIEGRYIFVYSF